MRIAIIGTRGIPNNYGGFEQLAEYLSVGLVEKGHEVFVYSSHDHPYRENKWKNVDIIHCYDPEYAMGTAGQFIYDLNCIRDSRKRKFDLIFQLGYTSSSIWSSLFPKNALLVTNMDGLEWKRSKYSKPVQRFLKYAEKLAVKKSDHLVADSLAIQSYLKKEYGTNSKYIPYGANVFDSPEASILTKFELEPYNYNMVIARLEPENSIDMICEGCATSKLKRKLIIIANHGTTYGKYLTEKFKADPSIIFLGPIYNIHILNNLRYHSNIYFHGHTVGGTNPSLLEAMSSQALVAANKNEFNASILNTEAYYFTTSAEVRHITETVVKNDSEKNKINSNLNKVRTLYSWEKIISDHEQYFSSLQRT